MRKKNDEKRKKTSVWFLSPWIATTAAEANGQLWGEALEIYSDLLLGRMSKAAVKAALKAVFKSCLRLFKEMGFLKA